MSNLGGIHDREGIAISPLGTWILDTIALSDSPPAAHYADGYEWICRANWGYGSTGTLPAPNLYGEYVARLVAYVSASRGCKRWVVGNEPNLSREWPNGQPIYPADYAACYRRARAAIHAISGHEQDEVLIAAPGPWNNELKYPGNPNGDWIKYFEDVIKLCGSEIDGFSIHAYTHGYNVALVTSSARMQAPFQNRHYEFRTYRDYCEAIPDNLAYLPIYLTEANGDGPWQAVGLMPAMLGEINWWNENAEGRKIRCVIFYRYPKYDQYAIEGKADVIAEYKAAIAKGYQSPGEKIERKKIENRENTVVLPAISSQPISSSRPAREWDARLTQRGVTVSEFAPSPGQSYWALVGARWFDEQEAGGRRHIYVEALDESGKPLANVPFTVTWPGGTATERTKAGRGFEAGNFPMSPSRNEFAVALEDGDVVRGIGMGADTPSGFNPGIHTSTLLTYQRKVATGQVPQVKQPAPTQPQPAQPPGFVTALSGLNLRAAPNTSSPILDAIPYGEQVRILGVEQDGWLRVRYNNGEGYAAAQYIGLQSPEPLPAPQPAAPKPPSAPQSEQEAFDRVMAFVLRMEGGLSTDPNDPGNYVNGRFVGTKYGISANAHPDVNIVNLTVEQAKEIYRQSYWIPSGASALPFPLCLAVMDLAVNGGVGTAQRALKEAGHDFIRYMAWRIAWYTRIDNFERYGRAWIRRCSELMLEASR